MMTDPVTPVYSLNVQAEADVAEVTRQVRKAGASVGFGAVDASYLATAASELATNLLIHAGGGVFRIIISIERSCIELATTDTGPGIDDIDLAMQDGFSTAGGLGCGLPGVKRLMDGIEIESRLGKGTYVRAWKFYPGHVR